MSLSAESRAIAALIGFVTADRRALSWPTDLTPLASTALSVTEVVARGEYPDHGEIARALLEHAADDPRYAAELGPLFAMWESGMPIPEAAAHANVSHGLHSDFPAAVHLLGGLLHAGDAPVAAAHARARAQITHFAPSSVDAAAGAAAAIAAAACDEDLLTAARVAAQTHELQAHLPRQAAPPGMAHAASSRGIEAVGLAIGYAVGSDSTEEAVERALRQGGTGAVAAMTGAVAGARFGVTSATEELSPGLYARLAAIASRLARACDECADNGGSSSRTQPA